MKIWFRRIIALALISLGIAMTFLPYNDTRSGSTEMEIVTIHKIELLSHEEVSAQFPGLEIIEITGSDLNPDYYPDLWRVFVNLVHYDYPNEIGDLSEWNSFQSSIQNGISKSRLVVFREGLISCSIDEETKKGKDNSEAVLFTYLGKYNPYIKELDESDLDDYPEIISIVKKLDAGNELNYESSTMPKNKWDRMVDRYLNPINDLQTFYFNGNFYGPDIGVDITYMSGSVTGLRTALKINGIIIMLIGFLLIKRLYFRKRGIMINPLKIAILYDVITLLLAVPSAYMVINTVLAKTLFITPITDENILVLQGIFFFCVGIPIVTLYTSRFISQSVEIDSDGIHVDSLIEKGSITWDSLKSVDFSDEYVLVSRVGIPIPRQLQKSLMLEDTSGQQLIINEPQLKSIKRQIALKFEEHAPDHLSGRIKQILSKW